MLQKLKSIIVHKKNKIWLFVSILVFLSDFAASGQVNDAGAWLSFSLEKKISRAFSLNLSPELRLNENFGEAGTMLSDFGTEYKISKSFKAAISYRFLMKLQPDNYYLMFHRFFGDISATEKIKSWQAQLRIRIQFNDIDMFGNDENASSVFIRSRLEIRKKTSNNFRLFLNTEPYFQLTQNKGRPSLDKIRFMAGTDYEINSKNMLKFYFLYQRECYHNNPEKNFVIGVNLRHSL